jgi:hypothetical protein
VCTQVAQWDPDDVYVTEPVEHSRRGGAGTGAGAGVGAGAGAGVGASDRAGVGAGDGGDGSSSTAGKTTVSTVLEMPYEGALDGAVGGGVGGVGTSPTGSLPGPTPQATHMGMPDINSRQPRAGPTVVVGARVWTMQTVARVCASTR